MTLRLQCIHKVYENPVSLPQVPRGTNNMNVGICKIQLRLPENGSLKDKRQLVRSVTDRTRNRFNVAVAEISDNENKNSLTLGICCVSNNSRHANEILSKTVDSILSTRLDAELLDYEIEILQGV